MADERNSKPSAMSPAFASLLNKANNTLVPKPNFGIKDQPPPKPDFSLSKFKAEPPKVSTAQADSGTQIRGSVVPNSDSGRPSKPICFGMLEPQKEVKKKTAASSPFANLMNKNKDVKQSFGSSALEKLSAKYLNSSQGLTPKFGGFVSSPKEVSTSNTISCPIFERTASSPADQSNEIRPLRSPLPVSNEIPIPHREHQDSGPLLSTSAGSSDFGSPSAKFTFSPIPNKTQSPAQTIVGDASPNHHESKLSSLSKLKDRYVKNSRTDGGSPSSPSLEDNRSKRFNFDLSAALVTRKDPVQNISGTSNINKILTPKRQTQERTIVVDQLSCVLDARTLLDTPLRQTAVASKRMSKMGKVICKKWKGGTCENLPVHYRTPYHIPAFKFDTMSPDEEIQSKFKRRR